MANQEVTVNSLYTDVRYDDKTRYNDILNGTNPWLKMRQVIIYIQKYVWLLRHQEV